MSTTAQIVYGLLWFALPVAAIVWLVVRARKHRKRMREFDEALDAWLKSQVPKP